MWIFGYGSILWKVDFPVEEQIVGRIPGYVRRFYQNSPDHRGTPDKPGRVVTLLPTNDLKDEVWGIAYLIPSDKVNDVLKHLDFRERNGYERRTATFYPKDFSESFSINFYIATETNKSFAGETTISNIAKQVVGAVGPSGPNVEYVLNLAATMRKIAPHIHDTHLFKVEAAVKKLHNST